MHFNSDDEDEYPFRAPERGSRRLKASFAKTSGENHFRAAHDECCRFPR